MCTESSRAYPMTNTHILLNRFEYIEPASLDEAISLMATRGREAALLAGGTSLILQLKQDQAHPRTIVNLGGLREMRGLKDDGDRLELGALTTIEKVRQLPAVQSQFQALADACAAFGSMQIQMMGTLGGNLCNGSPASDTVPALLAFDAAVALVGPNGERTVPLSQFLLAPGKVACRPGEVLTRVLLPHPPAGSGSAFIKITRVKADLAKISGAAVLVRQGDAIVDCHIAFGSVAPTVIRARKAEAFLRGKSFSPELALQAGEIAMKEISPIDDVRSTAWYRREVVKAVTHDLLVAAWDRAGQGQSLPVVSAIAPEVPATSMPLRVQPDETHLIHLTVNGEERSVRVAPNELLLNVLRERLEITGPKYGCGIGECGACTVLLNGRPALSCLTLAIAVDGAHVTTAEGLQAADGTLHPLQEAFLDHQAFQCGYCTPGILMMSKALLDDIAEPGEKDVQDYLRGNRCRCTGFTSIVRAVMSTVEKS